MTWHEKQMELSVGPVGGPWHSWGSFPHGNIGQGESLERAGHRQTVAAAAAAAAAACHKVRKLALEFTSGRAAVAQPGRLFNENAAVPHVWQA